MVEVGMVSRWPLHGVGWLMHVTHQMPSRVLQPKSFEGNRLLKSNVYDVYDLDLDGVLPCGLYDTGITLRLWVPGGIHQARGIYIYICIYTFVTHHLMTANTLCGWPTAVDDLRYIIF